MKKIMLVTALVGIYGVNTYTKRLNQEALPTVIQLDEFKTDIIDRSSWNSACKQIATNRKIIERQAAYPTACVSEEEFTHAIQSCIDLLKIQTNDAQEWVQGYKNRFIAGQWVQKLTVPADAKAIFHGDLHGDVLSLLITLERLEHEGYLRKDSFKLADENTYMLFLGDYTDRGFYGVECMYTIMRLKLANPNQVFLVRGNHESAPIASRYGFREELQRKFKNDTVFTTHISSLYEHLPAALFFGYHNNYIQCCHGGIPYNVATKSYSYNAQKLLRQNKKFDWIDLTDDNGFMWSDFMTEPEHLKKGVHVLPGRSEYSCICDQVATDLYLKTTGLKGIVRAHQHEGRKNIMMSGLIIYKGVFPLFISKEDSQALLALIDQQAPCGSYTQPMHISSVRTFNVSPDSIYGLMCEFDFDTCGILHVAKEYKDWTMQVLWTTNPHIAHHPLGWLRSKL